MSPSPIPHPLAPTFVVRRRQGFRTKATEAAEELCFVLVTLPLFHALR
jgi:hypothetical protein